MDIPLVSGSCHSHVSFGLNPLCPVPTRSPPTPDPGFSFAPFTRPLVYTVDFELIHPAPAPDPVAAASA
eukprot:10183174-Ditylum_brightwellii.AAC.1